MFWILKETERLGFENILNKNYAKIEFKYQITEKWGPLLFDQNLQQKNMRCDETLSGGENPKIFLDQTPIDLNLLLITHH